MSAPVTNISIKLAYDGTRYLGWQKTAMGPSIQEALEEVLSTILQEPVTVEAASRTDAGVHAAAQITNFRTAQTLDLYRLKHSLNSLLPRDISAVDVLEAAPEFHSTLDNIGKEYRYYICQGPYQMPIHRNFSWHFAGKLDVEAMRKAATHFLGEKDFSALLTERNEHPYKDHIREVSSIEIEELPEQRLLFKVAGRSFLYKMVRTLVGTLAYVGCQKIPTEDLPSILASKERARAGITAPAHGLHLASVKYP